MKSGNPREPVPDAIDKRRHAQGYRRALISLVLFAIAGLIGLARISSLADGSRQEIQHDRPAGQHEKSTKTSGTSQQHGFRSPA